MQQDLKQFMVRLASDLEALTEFITDPHGAIDRAGLSVESRAILLSTDQNRIYSAIANPPQPQAAWTGTAERPPAPAQQPAAPPPQPLVYAAPQQYPAATPYGWQWWPQGGGWAMPWYVR